MAQILEAVYENGIFRPLQMPDLSEGQMVQLVVSFTPDPAAVARVKRFRGILQNPDSEQADSEHSVVEELIQERREAAARE
jgi:predicted DNA-binding antitoxin AbrB/MazE fold protein